MLAQVSIDVLGSLHVRVDDADVVVDGERRRRLLAALVLRRGVECRTDWLIDVVWGDKPPAAAPATLQSHVSHLRRLLEPHRDPASPWRVLRTVHGGYLLAAEQVACDLDHFVTGMNAALRLDDPSAALAALDSALETVTGPAFEEHADLPPFIGESTRADELVLAALELRLDLLARTGGDAALIAAGQKLLVEHPLREHNWIRVAEALARTGRQAEALRALTTLRRTLADELGLDPSAEVEQLELRLLRPLPTTTPFVHTAGRGLGVAPDTNYADADGVAIAYQIVGSGPTLVAAPPFAQNIEICWQDPHHRRAIDRAAERIRFVHFDKRGTGMSDRATDLGVWRRIDDFLAVLDHADIDRAVLCGVSEAGPLAIAFADAHPDRVAGLCLINTFARVLRAPDHPIGIPDDQYAEIVESWAAGWGRDPSVVPGWFAPSLRNDRSYSAWLAHYMRQACSPGTLRHITAANATIDVRHLLPDVRVPTLVIHRKEDRVVPVSWGRYLAEHIPNAELVELEGPDHLPWVGDTWLELIDRVVEFTCRVSAQDGRFDCGSVRPSATPAADPGNPPTIPAPAPRTA